MLKLRYPQISTEWKVLSRVLREQCKISCSSIKFSNYKRKNVLNQFWGLSKSGSDSKKYLHVLTTKYTSSLCKEFFTATLVYNFLP